MHIKKIRLINFRNYENEEINLDEKINIIYGDNGEGKTNILESIFISAIGRSFRTNKEKELINLEKNNCKIEIEYEKNNLNKNIQINIEKNNFNELKKEIYLNKIKIKKTSELLGNICTVIFNPNDMDILKNGPVKRRKFLDIMISQLRPNYIYLLNNYKKYLDQRNIYLRQIKYENKSKELLDIWDEKIAEIGYQIYLYRKEFIEKIKLKINNIHSKITTEKEKINIKYISNVEDKNKYLINLKNQREIDIKKGYTVEGVHRDDFVISINNKQVSVYGSQGQQRTVIISLKLSELEVIYDEINDYPILLLDDFTSELDEKRIVNLLENIQKNQVIITSTNRNTINKANKYLKVENGKVL
ncbi:MAG: DNA replication/repair protein RecF [Lachnospiraceae bacterium]|jgi:DNA replication and repair protein RecF|nr:DNA replication/repair protein RecF [Lachnospiraceae bacterium]